MKPKLRPAMVVPGNRFAGGYKICTTRLVPSKTTIANPTVFRLIFFKNRLVFCEIFRQISLKLRRFWLSLRSFLFSVFSDFLIFLPISPRPADGIFFSFSTGFSTRFSDTISTDFSSSDLSGIGCFLPSSILTTRDFVTVVASRVILPSSWPPFFI